MALLIRHCRLNGGIRPLRELNKLRRVFDATRLRSTENKTIASFVPSRCLASRTVGKPQTSDEMETEVEQIYYGTLTKQIRRLKMFTIMSSLTGLAFQPFLFARIQDYGFSALVVGVGTFFGFFVLVTPLLIHSITKRYVIDMNYDAKTDLYTAYTYTLFLRRKKIEFTPDDVKVPDIPGMFTTAIVKGNPIFMDAKLFSDPEHYAKIMGYDKPISFKLETDTSEEEKK